MCVMESPSTLQAGETQVVGWGNLADAFQGESQMKRYRGKAPNGDTHEGYIAKETTVMGSKWVLVGEGCSFYWFRPRELTEIADGNSKA